MLVRVLLNCLDNNILVNFLFCVILDKLHQKISIQYEAGLCFRGGKRENNQNLELRPIEQGNSFQFNLLK